ncbi:MAG: glycosyltransferase [Verrucomicrobiota bacterium]
MTSTKSIERIVLWTPDPELTGGVQQYSRCIIEGLKSIVEIHVVPLKSTGPLAKLSFVLRALVSFIQHRPDVIWCTHLHLARVSLFFRFLNPTIWISLHGIDCWEITRPQDIHSLKRAKRLLCVSHYTLDRVAKKHPDVKDRLQWLPNHLAEIPEQSIGRSNARQQLNLSSGALVLLTVSRLSAEEQYKGHREVLHAMPDLLSEFPYLHYLVVGSGDDLKALQRLSRDLAIEEQVTFTGRLPDNELNLAYAAADLFVLPGKGEGFGIVLLDALVRGIPVLASTEDGSRDAVLDGELGDLANPNQQDSISDTLQRILQSIHSGQYPQSAETLRRKVIQHYGPEARDKRLRELVKEIR